MRAMKQSNGEESRPLVGTTIPHGAFPSELPRPQWNCTPSRRGPQRSSPRRWISRRVRCRWPRHPEPTLVLQGDVHFNVTTLDDGYIGVAVTFQQPAQRRRDLLQPPRGQAERGCLGLALSGQVPTESSRR
jgi:hypothetical protein